MEGSERLASRAEIERQTSCYAENCVRIFVEKIRNSKASYDVSSARERV